MRKDQKRHKTTPTPEPPSWLVASASDDNLGLVIEAKSRKDANNALTKAQHGQLLNAVEWFKKKYPHYSYIPISIHSNVSTTKSTVTNESRALTFGKLQELVADTRALLSELYDSVVTVEELVIRCEQLLATSTLKSLSLVDHYLVPVEQLEE